MTTSPQAPNHHATTTAIPAVKQPTQSPPRRPLEVVELEAVRGAVYQAAAKAIKDRCPCAQAGNVNVGGSWALDANAKMPSLPHVDVHAQAPALPSGTVQTKSEHEIRLKWSSKATKVTWWALLITCVCLCVYYLLLPNLAGGGSGSLPTAGNDTGTVTGAGVSDPGAAPATPSNATALEHLQRARAKVRAQKQALWYRSSEQERVMWNQIEADLDKAIGALGGGE